MKKVFFFSMLAAGFCLMSFTSSPGKPSLKPFKTYVMTTSDNIDLSGVTYNPCTDEFIDFSGSLHEVLHSSYNDQTGKVVNDLKINTQGVKGTGETSGNTYQLNEQVTQGEIITNGCVVTSTFTVHDVWTTPGANNNFWQDIKVTYVTDYCAGTYTVTRDIQNSGCR